MLIDSSSNEQLGICRRRNATISCDANTQSMNVRHPVSTMRPDVNNRHVHTGSDNRIVMAANFCLSYVLLGMILLITCRFSGVCDVHWYRPSVGSYCVACLDANVTVFSIDSSTPKNEFVVGGDSRTGNLDPPWRRLPRH